MKIVYCIGALKKTGGAERVLVNKANYLAEVFGYTVFILIANQGNLPLCYKVSKKVKIIDMKIVSYFDKKNIPIFSFFKNIKKLRPVYLEKIQQISSKYNYCPRTRL